MARRRRRRSSMFFDDEGINLTPLLDVIFNLIFFFIMATTIRTRETFFNLTLPTARQSTTAVERPPIPEVSVARDGALMLNGEAVDPADLPEKLEKLIQETGEKRVVLSADGEATVQQSVDAMDIIRQAGVTSVIQRVQTK